MHLYTCQVLPSPANTSYTNLNQQSDSQGISPLICCSTATKDSVTADPNPLNLIVYFSWFYPGYEQRHKAAAVDFSVVIGS